MSRIASLIVAVAALAALLAPAPAKAIQPVIDTTYYFSGSCIDCYAGNGTAYGDLVLQNYTLGTAITAPNFVSFTYDGTDLLSGYTLTSLGSISGTLPATLPGAPAVDLFIHGFTGSDQAYSLVVASSGYWCTGTGSACTSDNGFDASFNGIQLISVPEPASLLLLATPLAALALRRRR